MYRKILVALENSTADESLIRHITELASRLDSELLLLHVADGWAARNFDQLKLAESEEMKGDRAYLEQVADRFRSRGLKAATLLARGDPPKEIVRAAHDQLCDLIALSSHGHRLLGDLIHGSTVNEVRHATAMPVLVVRAEKK